MRRMADETTSPPPAPIDHCAEALRWISLSANNGQSPEAAALIGLTHAVLALVDETGNVGQEIASLFVIDTDNVPLIKTRPW